MSKESAYYADSKYKRFIKLIVTNKAYEPEKIGRILEKGRNTP